MPRDATKAAADDASGKDITSSAEEPAAPTPADTRLAADLVADLKAQVADGKGDPMTAQAFRHATNALSWLRKRDATTQA